MRDQYSGKHKTMFSSLSTLHHGPTISVPGYHMSTVAFFGGRSSDIFIHSGAAIFSFGVCIDFYFSYEPSA